MKKIITLLALCCLPMLAAAQSLTAAQKEEALRTVTEFCSFVERFCKGERTLDTQIYALCSGRGCSTFDDIGTNSETKMENYLSAIQKTYARSLQTEISAPSLAKSKTYMEPEVGLSTQWGNFGMSELSTTMVTEADAVGISNQYIAFDVVQSYQALGKSMEKKIVYDVNNRKITAFITGGGTFISFLEGVSALTAKDYSSAVKYFDAASQNERDPAFQKRCNLLSAICCAYTLDIESAFKYAQKAGDELYIANFGHMLSLMHENFEEASKYASSLSDIIESRTDMTQYQKSCAYTMLGSFFVEAPTPYQDVEKGVAYLKRASSLGNPAAKYAIFIYQMNRLIPDEMLGDDESVKLMVEAAEMGYPPALTMAGFLEEYFRKNSQKATMWYEKAAQAGNPIGMALYGRMLMKAGNEYEAKKWLNKSLEGQGFENQIKEYELQFGAYFFPWPKSRQDVIDMLGTSSTDGGSHDGGYSTFRFDLTSALEKENLLEVLVDNRENDRVYPQKADFTFYGGIYRDVNLIQVPEDHFDLDYFGSKAIKIEALLKDGKGEVTVCAFTTSTKKVEIDIRDREGNGVLALRNDEKGTIDGVHLWDGREDPYLYTAVARIVDEDGSVLDEVSSRFGFRTFSFDSKKGFPQRPSLSSSRRLQTSGSARKRKRHLQGGSH